MQWFPAMFCHAGPPARFYVKFSRMVIYKLKKTEVTLPMENCIVTESKLLLGSPHELHQLPG